MKKPSQKDMYYAAVKRTAELDQAVLELLYGHNPLTDLELAQNIARRPSLWSRYAGFIGQRVGAGAVYWGA